VTREHAVRTDSPYPGFFRRFSASTLVLTGLVYVLWATACGVIVVVAGLALASVLSRVFAFDRLQVAAFIITTLAAATGASAPLVVIRLQASLGRVRAGGHNHQHRDLS
jgi:hypothetical protein